MNDVFAPCCTSPTLGGTPGTSEPGSPPSHFCSFRLTLPSFCPHCQLALSPPFSASLGTQCHCSRPPWLSLGSSWDRLRTQAGRLGCSVELSEGRELMVYGVETGSLEGIVCGPGLGRPESFTIALRVTSSFLNPSHAAGAEQPARSLVALGTKSTIGQRRSESHLYRASN